MGSRPAFERLWQSSARELLVVAAVTVCAACLRFVAIDALPPGLYHDEAFNGLDALRVLDGETPIFFEANNGREPLFVYLLATSVGVFGRSPGALRLVSALLGTVSIPAIYWLAKELFGPRVALLSAALAVANVWMLNLSRVVFRASAMVPLLTLSLAALWHGYRRRNALSMGAAGALLGLSQYSYLPARFAAIALLFFMLYIFLQREEALWWRGGLVFWGAALIVVAPLAWYALGHWDSVFGACGTDVDPQSRYLTR